MWCDCYDGCVCDDELLCRRWRKTMMMMKMYVCDHRYKYVCVYYQFLSPYWLQHIHIIDYYVPSHSSSYTLLLYIPLSTYYYFSPHLISLLLLPSFSSISLYTISYSTVPHLSMKHVIMDMRVLYWYCYTIKQTLTFKMR